MNSKVSRFFLRCSWLAIIVIILLFRRCAKSKDPYEDVGKYKRPYHALQSQYAPDLCEIEDCGSVKLNSYINSDIGFSFTMTDDWFLYATDDAYKTLADEDNERAQMKKEDEHNTGIGTLAYGIKYDFVSGNESIHVYGMVSSMRGNNSESWLRDSVLTNCVQNNVKYKAKPGKTVKSTVNGVDFYDTLITLWGDDFYNGKMYIQLSVFEYNEVTIAFYDYTSIEPQESIVDKYQIQFQQVTETVE